MKIYIFSLEEWDDKREIHLPEQIILVMAEEEQEAIDNLCKVLPTNDKFHPMGEVKPLYHDTDEILIVDEIHRQVNEADRSRKRRDRMHSRKVRQRRQSR